MADIMETVCAVLQNILGDSYGDTQDSDAGDRVVGEAWTPILTTSRPSIVRLFNSGIPEVQLSPNPNIAVGGRLAAGGVDIWDRFEGTLYGRVAVGAGTGTVNFLTLARRFKV